MAQILEIVVLGVDPSRECNSFIRDAERKSLVCKRETINYDNDDHVRLIEEVREANKGANPTAPIVCFKNAEGGLSLIRAGYSMATIKTLVGYEAQLQSQLVSAASAVL